MSAKPALDPRIDAYIARSAGFAQPILEHLRKLVHEACPQVEETIKWGMPSFVHGDGILCHMAAFKQHAAFGFWKHALVMGEDAERDGMGSFGKLASLRDLPPKQALLALVRKAAILNEQGVKVPSARKAGKPSTPRPPPVAPPDLVVALEKNREARATFDAFPPSHKREYVEWISEAKRPETRARRLAQAIEWMADGRPRNWKHAGC